MKGTHVQIKGTRTKTRSRCILSLSRRVVDIEKGERGDYRLVTFIINNCSVKRNVS